MAVPAEDVNLDLNCLLLPLGSLSLLVPSACVVEVLPWRRVRTIPDMPAWLLGVTGWRGDSIPVLRFEPLNGAVGSFPAKGSCVAVMNRCRSATSQPFYGIATDSLPRMVQVSPEDIDSEQTHAGIAETAVGKIGSEQVRVPNLGYIEDQLAMLAKQNRFQS